TISKAVKIFGLMLAVYFIISMATTRILPVAGNLIGVDVSVSGDEAYEACLDFNRMFYVRDFFFDEKISGSNAKTSMAEKLRPYVGGSDLEERYQNAKIFCGASITLVKGGEDGELEKAVSEVNELYERYGANFDFSDLNTQVQNERKAVWLPYVLTRVTEDFSLMGGVS
ncbi:MAG: hypothetical protein GOU98_02050, partial [Candidatus Altiarchaeota archaeon]|nr:hypothetical protein [Candidatus Altiarchaeota archaeon]